MRNNPAFLKQFLCIKRILPVFVFLLVCNCLKAQVPVISSFSPTSGPVGTVVTITGNNFSPTAAGNTVYFGAVKAVVSAASSTSLTVTVPVGTTYQPLTVTANNLTAYAGKPFVVTFPSNGAGFIANSFADKADFVTGLDPQSISVGDLDGDGKTDMAVANYYSGTVSTFRNTGSATVSFAAKVDFVTGSNTYSVAIGDLDGDGKPDLAVASYSSNRVSVLRNTSTFGAISFATKVDFVTGSNPFNVAIGDLDGDGKSDLAVANYGSHTVSVFRNTSTIGAVSFGLKEDYATGSYPCSIAIGNLDGDGQPELAVANQNSFSISVFKNFSTTGTLSFATKVDYTTGSYPYSVAIGDIDSDDKPDLVSANSNSNTVSILKNTGTAGAVSFAAKVDLATGSYPYSVAISDINGDGKPDLAVANYNANTVSVLRNTGSGSTVSFATKADYPTGGSPYSIAIGDMDGDGKPDLTTANYGTNNVSVLKNQTDGPNITSFAPANAPVGTTVTIKGTSFTGTTAVSFGGIAATSFSVVSDTIISAVVGGIASGNVVVTTPKGTSRLIGFYNGPVISSFSPASGPIGTAVTITGNSFSPALAGNTVYFGAVKATVTAASSTSLTVTVPAGATYQPITVTASNLTAYTSNPFVVTFPSNPAGITPSFFTDKVDYTTGSNPYSVASGDLDGDGKTDIVVTNFYAHSVSVFKNTGNSTVSFAVKNDYSTGNYPLAVSIGDLDGDGKPDLAVTNSNSNSVSVFRNISTGGNILFDSKVDYATGTYPYSVAIGDLDGDGKPELATANANTSTLSVLKNLSTTGTISFAGKVDYNTGSYPYGVAIGDLDGDSKPDLAVVNYSSYTVSVFKNLSIPGTISLATKIDFATGIYPYSIAIGDVDGDNKTDMVVANYNSSTVSVLRNTSTVSTISFAVKVDFATGTNPRSVVISDMNGDGKPDLTTANYGSNTFSLLKNNSNSGTISFAPKADFAAGTNPYSVAIGDVDNDGNPDVSVANYSSNTISILRSQADGPNITSFTPSNAAIGATVTIKGTSFTGTTAVSFGGTPATSFTVVSDTIITAIVGAIASGTVAVTTPNGTAYVSGFYNGPVISSFSPTSGPIGTTVTISGNSFNPSIAGNIVYFGAVKATVTAATATSLTITVPVGATYQPVTVTSNSFTAYTSKPFVVTFPSNPAGITPSFFAGKVDYATGNNPYNLALGDLDGDGKTDIAVANYNASTVSIFRNSGSGTVSFATKADYSTNSRPIAVTVGDINGDGKPDLAVANSTMISIFRNTSTGGTISFAARVDFTIESTPYSIAIGDVDGDGKPDLAVAGYSSNTVSILRNTGTAGSIAFAAKVDYATGSSPQSIGIGDMDGDGKPDLAVANSSSSTVSVFKNLSISGSISFAGKVDYATGAIPYSVAVGDLDGDGKPDITVVNYNSSTVSVLRNTSTTGTVSFAAKVDFAAGTTPRSVAISDLTGDGKLDLTVTNYSSNTISLLKNTGSIGTVFFATKADYTTGTSPYFAAIGDVDNDGKPDVGVVNYGSNTVSILRSQADGPNITSFVPPNAAIGATVTIKGTSFTGTTAVSFGGTPATGFTVVSDTIITAIVGAIASGTVAVTTPNGTAYVSGFYNGPVISSFSPTSGPIGTTVTISGNSFNPSIAGNIVYFGAVKATVTAATATSLTITVPVGATYQPVTVTSDNFTAYTSKPFVVTFPSNPAGINYNSFADKTDYTTGSNAYSISLGDLDGDGKTDIAVPGTNSYIVSVFRNTGTTGTISFGAKTDYTVGTYPYSIAIGDLDGDGKQDLAVANTYSNTISVLRNTSTSGNISFAAKVDYVTGSSPQGISIGDLDGDGKPDLAVVNSDSYTVSVFKNLSTGVNISFAPKIDYSTGSYPYGIAIGDVDSDGKPDLAVTNSSSSTVSILRNLNNTGTISFAPKVDFAVGSTPYIVTTGDWDGDGKLDLAVANSGTNTVSVLRNTSTGSVVSFATKIDYVTGTNPYSVAAGDINGDGKPDLAVTNDNANTVSVLRNTGTAGTVSFAVKADYTTGTYPYGVAIGDLDSDGRPDLATTNYSVGSISLLKNQTDAPYITSFIPDNAAIGDAVTIKGSNLTGATAVSFGGIAATSFTVVSDTIITAIVGAITSGEVKVTTAAGAAILSGFYNGPAIASFSPVSGAIGTTVTIIGTNFNATAAGNTVYFGAVKAVVTAASSTSLTVTVPVGATYQPITVTANNFTAYAGKPFVVTFSSNTTGFAANSFANKVDYPTGTNPYSVSLGDLDGDGKTDMAIANYGTHTVSVFKNTGNSTVSFAAKVDYPTGSYPTAVAIGDVDGDGKPDLAVVNYSSSTVSVFRNTSAGGNISFGTRVDYTTGGNPYYVAIGDLNNDGKPDLIVANYGSNSISILRNTSTGGSISFATKVDYTTTSYPRSISVGDLDGDNKPDLAVANSNFSTVSVFRNISIGGTISFTSKVDYATGSSPYSIAIGDMDDDGKSDLALVNSNSNTVSVLRNTSTSGNISFAAKVDYPTGTNPYSITVGDIDGDGKPDLAATNYGSNTVSVFRNNSTGGTISFAAKADYITGTFPYSVALGDLDGDGKLDLAVANYGSSNVSVLKYQNYTPIITSFTPGNAGIGAVVTIKGINFTGATAVSFGGIAATSFTIVSDTIITAIVGAIASGDVKVTTPKGTATVNGFFNGHTIISFSPTSGPIGTTVTITGSNFAPTTAGNIVYFGAVKAVVTAASSTSLTVTVPVGATYQPLTATANNLTAYANKPFVVTFSSNTTGFAANSFADKVDYTSGGSPFYISLGDLDGDGKTDMAVVNNGSNTVSVFKNTGSSTISFATKADYPTGSNPYSVAIGDIDGDGKPDLAVANYSSSSVSVFRNTSTGGTISFAAKADYITGAFPYSIAIGDVDGDGKPDLAVTNINSNTVSILKNISSSGIISFEAKRDYATGNYPRSISISDVDGDSKPDLAVANSSSYTISVLKNLCTPGTISFAGKVDFATGSYPAAIAAGDLDGDGKPDLLSVNYNSYTISVLRNTSSNGIISFAPKADYATGSSPYGTAIGDLDGDGKPDLLSANYSSGTASVLRNTGTIGTVSFAAKVDYVTGSSLYSVAIGDIDNDGKPDLATANYGSGTVSILRNQISTTRLTIGNPSDTALCAGTDITIPFTVNQPLNASNVFTAQLSNPSGSFTSPVAIGTLTGNTSDTVHAVVPANTVAGLNYHVRIIASSPAIASEPNQSAIVINRPPGADFTINGNTLICSGLQTYTVSGVTGTNIQYNWTLSGGGILDTTVINAPKVNWTDSGVHTLSLTLANNCGSGLTKSIQVTVSGNPLTGSFINLSPATGSTNLMLPLSFSWDSIGNALYYDLYIWPQPNSRPATPLVSFITQSNYTITDSTLLQYERVYNWQVVTKRDCYTLQSTIRTFTLRYSPDLTVDSIYIPTTGFAGKSFSIRWKVKNTGRRTTTINSWTDRVYISASPAFSPGSALVQFNVVHNGGLAPGGSYMQTLDTLLPADISGTYYVHVFTDAASQLTEYNTGGETNNVLISTPFTIVLKMPADLIVKEVAAPVKAAAGQKANIKWTVKNQGDTATALSLWYDKIYISTSPTFTMDNAMFVASYPHTGGLAPITEYSNSVLATIPVVAAGNYYVYVVTDAENGTAEYDETNNTRRSTVSIPTGIPDLKMASITASAAIGAGQKLRVAWTVSNVGSGAIENSSWTDRIFLSPQPVYTPGNAIWFDVKFPAQTLDPGHALNRQIDLSIPDIVSGPYYVYVYADYPNTVYEDTSEYNNVSRSLYLSNITTGVPVRDIGMSELITPKSDCGLTAEETVTVKITNYGNLPHTGFTVGYTINNNVAVTENVSSLTLLPRSSINYSFTAKADLSATGDYNLRAFTSLPNDTTPSNDTLITVVQHFPDLTTPSNLLPQDNASNLDKPVNFSWSAVPHALQYDLFLWKSTDPMPSEPVASNLTQINFTYNGTLLVYGLSYKWKVVAKTTNCQTASDVQFFTLRNLPDIVVDSIIVPTNGGTSETNFSLSWKTKNIGLGGTRSVAWYESVYISESATNRSTDSLLGNFPNISALDAGQSYTHPLFTFRIPQSYQGRYYIVVKTDAYNRIEEVTDTNNTRVIPIEITLAQPPDLQIDSLVVAPSNLFSEDTIQVKWVVKNGGTGPTTAALWFDKVYLSKSRILNVGNASLLYSYLRTGALAVGESYAKSVQLRMPVHIGGTHYIHVVTDAANNVFEYVNEDNNTATWDSLNVIMRPNPNLVSQQVSTSADTVSNNQSLPIQWITKNEGAAATNRAWTDNVRMTADTANGYAAYFSVGYGYQSNILQSLSATGNQQMIQLPANLVEGRYYFYVVADIYNSVFEDDETDNVSPYSAPVYVVNPDLKPVALQAPATVKTEDTVAVSWAVQNVGKGSVIGSSWADAVYLSQDTAFDASSDPKLAYTSQSGLLPVGNQYTKQQTVVIPRGVSGSYYLILVTDVNNGVFEKNESNNRIRIPITITTAPWPDLTVTAVQLPPTDTAGTPLLFTYTARNNGPAKITNKSWSDGFYLSPTKNGNDPNRINFSSVAVQQSLDSGQSYTKKVNVVLPSYVSGPYYLHVAADYSNNIYEYNAEANNSKSSDTSVFISQLPNVANVDLTAISGKVTADSLTPGQTVSVEWYGGNNGSTANIITQWEDAIYLSNNTVLDASDHLLKTVTINKVLASGVSYSQRATVTIPNDASGTLYFLLNVDKGNVQNDGNRSNNTRMLTIILTDSGQVVSSGGGVVIPPQKPVDLVPVSFESASAGISGQPITVSYLVTNNKAGKTASNSWTDKVYLSTDYVPDGSDIEIGSRLHTGSLDSNAQYTDTLQVFIPRYVSGNYVVLFKTDASNNVFELNGENNNTAFANIFILPQQPCDLVVNSITPPAGAQMAGQTITVAYSIENKGSNPAQGLFRDAVYLSTDTTWDAGDLLLGLTGYTTNYLPPQSVISKQFTQKLTNVAEGAYYVIVRTDILNNMLESDEANNHLSSTSPMAVEVKLLTMEVQAADMLVNGELLYYRINIPASLKGETMQLTLRGDSVKRAVNRLYLRYGNAPAPNAYDFASEIAFSANQEIIVPELKEGTYYILATGNDTATRLQPVVLLAHIVPFEVTMVNAAKGGNTGTVTVKINGAKFDSTTTFKLTGANGTIPPAKIYYTNSTQVFATFNLLNASLGLYNVVATKAGNDSARLLNRFEVVRGPGSTAGDGSGSGPGSGSGFVCQVVNVGFENELETGVYHPGSTRPNRYVAITIYYENRGTVDIPTPTRFFVSLKDSVPVAFSPDLLVEKKTELVLDFTEAGGPPGILRLGASGYIKVYSIAYDRSIGSIDFMIVE